jgi:uncharacterized membrane protein YdbT with pleckstrin-like domain
MTLRMFWKAAESHFELLMITNRRLLRVSGIFNRKIQSMPLSEITDLTYSRDPLGRLLGYGKFMVESAGDDEGALSKIQYVPSPDRLYLAIVDMTLG